MSGCIPHHRLQVCMICALCFVICQFVFLIVFLRNGVLEDTITGRLLLHRGTGKENRLFGWREFISHTPEQPGANYQYNLQLSDTVGAIRSLPRTRHESCDSKRTYNLPHSSRAKVSVVISFYNEARSMLLRTIISLVSRTPEDYLHELILIDDASQDVSLLEELQKLMEKMYATRARLSFIFLRNLQRQGMIWSRNRGAEAASGHYLLFLDSHCEVNEDWLEPLLDRLSLNATLAVSPLLDHIDPATLSYRSGNDMVKGGFDWNLHFHWLKRELSAKEAPEQPFKSPAFSGGVLMISRDWFLKLRCFNPNLKIWGGESIELAIKLWLCGGQIEIVPCSRIGHIFRPRHAFDFPPQFNHESSTAHATYLHNSKIIADSWLDEYKNMFYVLKPAARQIPLFHTNQDEDLLRQLKLELRCQRFDWYLRHVSPELKAHFNELSAMGTLKNGYRCLHARRTDNVSQLEVILDSCYLNDITQWRLLRKSGQLSTATERCLGVERGSMPPRLTMTPCSRHQNKMKAQRWLRRGTHLVHTGTYLCLDNPLKNQLVLSPCRSLAASQSFQFALEMEKQT
ncbi:putative polypeptide N-acetylgalactosaminyltransferase 13 [Drosophila pseudoobscura]|uniref:Polypeptide N-acetylgalactosaminyltransferase n=1 Tax=Drosophila pseudoobscura pseudoobscura TaxID=46245 RepID=A0A6I8V1X3_DROPS|nr:putative polypeptide N-acetylgalactosaminyltransferase 13 [Drosophila pseudoobscura]